MINEILGSEPFLAGFFYSN